MSTTEHPHLTIEHLLVHRSWLRAVARSLVRDEHAADDLVQDTFVAGLRRPPRDEGSVRAWLRTVARNLARDRHRVAQARARREAVNAVDESLVATVDVVERAELQRELTRHVLELDEPYRTTVLLRYFDELPPREVAEQMGVPVETVRTRARRALAKLRESLGEERGDDWRLALLPLLGGPPAEGPDAPAPDPWVACEVASASAASTLVPLAVASGVAIVAAAALTLVVMEDDGPPGPEMAETATEEPEHAIAPERERVAQDRPKEESSAETPAPAPAEKADGAPPIILDAPPRSEPMDGEWTSAAPPGMASISGHTSQVIGMDEDEIRHFLTSDLGRDLAKWERFPFLWEHGFLFMTPRHATRVLPFAIARHELTNAQWQVFLDAPDNQARYITAERGPLRALVMALYGLDADEKPVDAQIAGLELYRRNAKVLRPLLDPDGDPEWEPLLSWVRDTPIPAGVELDLGLILPPAYWRDGRPLEADRNLPARGMSWVEARAFCRWAGYHLPLEAEWERAARGDDARRFPWGDEWNPALSVHRGRPGPIAVDALPAGATPEGVQHLLGNVSEYVFDIAREYPGSRSPFRFNGAGCLARGGSFADEEYVMLAADRIWDCGSTQIGPDSRAETFGFRPAAYSQPGRGLALDLAVHAAEFDRLGGVAHWLPIPPGLSKTQAVKPTLRRPFQGFSLERSAGWMERRLDQLAADHAYVRGPARGIALLPVKGLRHSALKTTGSLRRLALDADHPLLLGALLTTVRTTVQLSNGEGAMFEFDMRDVNSDAWADHDLGFTYQVGLWLVLRGDRVAVYGGNGSAAGVNGKHLRGKPLGYLPAKWEADWAVTAGAKPSAGADVGSMRLSVPIPQLDDEGGVKRGGKTALVTIRVPVIFAD